MAVVGGGVIGCEYACLFAALGIPLTLIDGRDRMLPFLDKEIGMALQERIAALGVQLHLGERVAAVQEIGRSRQGDAPLYRLQLESGRGVEAEAILVASGRSGNTAGLGLEAAGVPAGKRGLIEVDDHFRTAVPYIYAAGDVIGFPALASTSMEQARLAMCHAFDLRYKTALAPQLPFAIYTIPEVSAVGETEESARSKGLDFTVGRAAFEANARGQIIGDAHGFLKLIFSGEDMRLIGVHVIGENASEIIHIGLTAMLVEQGADLFIQTCFNYPTLSETYKYATYDAMGRRQRQARR